MLRHTPEVGAVFGKPHAVSGTPSLGLNWLTHCRIAPPRSCLTFAISLSSARSWLREFISLVGSAAIAWPRRRATSTAPDAEGLSVERRTDE